MLEARPRGRASRSAVAPHQGLATATSSARPSFPIVISTPPAGSTSTRRPGRRWRFPASPRCWRAPTTTASKQVGREAADQRVAALSSTASESMAIHCSLSRGRAGRRRRPNAMSDREDQERARCSLWRMCSRTPRPSPVDPRPGSATSGSWPGLIAKIGGRNAVIVVDLEDVESLGGVAVQGHDVSSERVRHARSNSRNSNGVSLVLRPLYPDPPSRPSVTGSERGGG